MQENTRFTLDFFDKNLRILSEFAFDIDKESKAILGIIAKHGPSTETKITSLGKRRIILSRDIIRRRLIFKDLSSDFLSVKKGKKIGNLKGKREKFYSLTLKGFLASLAEIPIQENFWIKNYIEMIKEITDDITSQELLKHIYYSVGVFLILNSRGRGLLTSFSKPEEVLYENYNWDGELNNLVWKNQVIRVPKQYNDLFIHSTVQFFVSCEVLGRLLRRTLDKNLYVKDPDDVGYDETISVLFRDWMSTMFLAVSKSPKQILGHSEKIDYEEDDVIDFDIILGDEKSDNILFMAADELNRIKPELKIDPINFVNKGRTGHGHSLLEV